MDRFAPDAAPGRGVCVGAACWDCGRELHALRDASARSRAEEASAARRSAEEAERCALRRQTEESLALQSFLSGFHDSVEARLEGQRLQCANRFEALELRLQAEEERLGTLRGQILAEAQWAVRELVGKLQRSVGLGAAPEGGEEKDAAAAAPAALDEGMARLGADLKAVARAAAEAAIEEVAGKVGVDLTGLHNELSAEAARRGEELQGLARRVDAAEAESAVAMAEAAEDFTERLSTLGASIVEHRPHVEESLDELGASLRERTSNLGGLELAVGELSGRLGEASASSAGFQESLRASVTACESEVGTLQIALPEQLQASTVAMAAAGCAELAAATRFVRGELDEVELLTREEAARTCAALQRAEARLEAQIDARARATEAGPAERAAGAAAKAEASLEMFASNLRGGLHAAAGTAEQATKFAAELRDHVEGTLAVRTVQTSQECKEIRAEIGRNEQRCREEGQALGKVWRPEARRFTSELQDMRSDTKASASQWRAVIADHARSLETISANCGKLASEVAQLRRQGVSHQWTIPRCMQRLQYLVIDSDDGGVWLDSPEFALGSLGRATLRLYPRGVKGGDGQCAAGLYVAGAPELRPLPMRLDLQIAGLARQAAAKTERDGNLLFFAASFGAVEALLQEGEDLVVGVDVPPAPPTVWASLGLGRSIDVGAAAAAAGRGFRDAPAWRADAGLPPRSGLAASLSSSLESEESPLSESPESAVPALVPTLTLEPRRRVTTGMSSAGTGLPAPTPGGEMDPPLGPSRGSRPASAGRLGQRAAPQASAATGAPPRLGWAIFGEDGAGEASDVSARPAAASVALLATAPGALGGGPATRVASGAGSGAGAVAAAAAPVARPARGAESRPSSTNPFDDPSI